MSAGCYWSVMRTSLLAVAEEVVGYGGRVQPDWFQESSEILMPLKDVKNAYRKRMLQNDIPPLRQEFRKSQRVVKAAVYKAREDWILKVANEAESAMSKGNVQWEFMKKLQVAYCSCKSLQVNTIVDENGNTLSNHSDICARWQHHFLNVLNVPSNYKMMLCTLCYSYS